MSSGIKFNAGQSLEKESDLNKILGEYDAVYLAEGGSEDLTPSYSVRLGENWQKSLDQKTNQVAGHPGIFIGEEYLMNGVTVVDAVARGRLMAMAIEQYLGHQGKITKRREN